MFCAKGMCLKMENVVLDQGAMLAGVKPYKGEAILKGACPCKWNVTFQTKVRVWLLIAPLSIPLVAVVHVYSMHGSKSKHWYLAWDAPIGMKHGEV